MVSNLILLAIGAAMALYLVRGMAGAGWHWPEIDPGSWGGGLRLPDTGSMGDALGCKWRGTC